MESHRYLLKNYLANFGMTPLGKINPDAVRSWHGSLITSAPPSVPPRAYRLLHSILETAAEDGLIGANPCRIRGAGMARSAERPILGPGEIAMLADSIEPRWRALVLLAAYGQLRFGELMGLRRRDLDLRSGVVSITAQLAEVGNNRQERTPPKSEAGNRRVNLPPFVVDELRRHLATYVSADDLDAPIFAGTRGGAPMRRNWARIWGRARRAADLPRNVTLHDLRHAGATMAAQLGGTTKELMARLGHASPRAALIYQHAVDERDHALAAALDRVGREAAESARARGDTKCHRGRARWMRDGA